jgi:uncharacterized protein (UPF0147 family)
MINKNSGNIKDIIQILCELCDDNTIPKNIKVKFQDIVNSLRKEAETSIKVNRALQNLDEINEDSNLQPYIRTQVWNLVSMLEKV